MQSHQLATPKQSGFSAVEALLIVLVIAALATCGFVVHQRLKSTNTKSTAATSPSQSTGKQKSTTDTQPAQNVYAGWKTYTSSADNFSIKYPPTWALDSKNGSAGTVTADYATLTSPSKTVLHMYADTGGKGGWCTPKPSDVPFQKGNGCTTLEYLTSEKLPVDNLYYEDEVPNTDPVKFVPKQAPVYLVTTHYADQSGVSSYGISIAETTTPKDTFALNTPYMGSNPPYTWLTVYDAKGKGYPYVYVYTNGGSPSFLTSEDASTIKNIIRSFSLNI